MRRLFLTVLVLAVSSGCALRPRYRDFVTETTPGPEAKLVLFEKDSDRKLGGVKLEMSEWKNRVSVTTGPDGSFSLPVDKKYLDENPVLVVTLPAGISGYEIEPATRAEVTPSPEDAAKGTPATPEAPGPTPSTTPNPAPPPPPNK